MYAIRVRAFRSVALYAPKARITTRRDRHFHVSASLRAAADESNSNDEPRDDRDKPTSDESNHEGSRDENLFGENGTNGNGENQGRRQRRSNGSLRSRALRNRVPEELPPIHMPGDFHEKHIFRHESPRENLLVENVEFSTLKAEATGIIASTAAAGLSDAEQFHETLSTIFNTAAWNNSDVHEAQTKKANDVAYISERGNVLCAAAFSLVANIVSQPAQHSASLSSMLETIAGPPDTTNFKFSEMLARLLRTQENDPNLKGHHLPSLKRILHSKVPFRGDLGLLHHDLILEAVCSIRAEFALAPPKSIKFAELKRPVTVLNFPYYSGFTWPRQIVQDIAAEIEADVLHLTAQAIGRAIGSYLGQDITRAPGPVSLLGYKAAENAGRIHRQTTVVDENEPGFNMGIQFMLPGEKPMDRNRRDAKKKLTIMEHLIGEPNRGKSDEMWEDLKINAVLEELINTADSNTSEQRPLIVHIHDFNALNMDDECGAVIVGKLRKVIDAMWSEGRKIVLVGTCASLKAPRPYKMALKEMELAEHVITLQDGGLGSLRPLPSPESEATESNEESELAESESVSQNEFLTGLQRAEYLDENADNIGTMLDTLLSPGYDDGSPLINFSLHLVEEAHRPKSLSEGVLPLTEVYRIAKTMIGLHRHQPESFDQSVLEDAIRLIQDIDMTKSQIPPVKDTPDAEGRSQRAYISGGMTGPHYEGHEDKLLSGMINPKDIRTTFNDIHAPKETIESIKMLTQLSLLRPEAFSYGVLSTDRIPGCLLYGPPGTGKTLLAKAVAKESGANMIEISGASINNMYYGESEKNVRAIFKLAKKKEPMVIFIDEADAMLGSRGRPNEGGARRDIVNQFLREWDGMDKMKAFIMVATNRPFDLDDAVLRRLPRKILVDLPLEQDRAAILKIHLKGELLDDSVSIEEIAKQTPLYSGSDLKNVCVAAAMAAVKEEIEASNKHTGPEPYVWAEKRILSSRHLEKALGEIPASVSEDMSTLNAIKRFDERYGDRKLRRKKRGMGFEVVPEAVDSNDARVRRAAR